MRSAYGIAIAACIGVALIGANLANGFAAEPAASEVRLIGECNGRLLAAMEESSFPAGCEWIEPIRFDPEPAGDSWKELESAAIVYRGLVESR